MEQRHSKSKHFLHHQLRLVHVWVLCRIELLVQVVFAESQDGDHISALADGELDETLPLLKDQFERARFGIEGFARAADNNSNGAAHSLTIAAALGEDVFAALAGDGGEAHSQGVVAVEGHAEVGVEGEEGVCDSGEELFETESFGGKGREGAVRDDAVRVIAKYVLAGWLERHGTVEASWVVGGEEGPDATVAREF
jgi:hypothetical protein